jgi:glutamate/aspartate transport system permease protein
MFEAAFYCEIIRAGINNVRQGQSEAGLATGLRRWQVMRLIVMPQAMKRDGAADAEPDRDRLPGHLAGLCRGAARFPDDGKHRRRTRRAATEMYTLVAVVYLIICLSSTKGAEFYRRRPSRHDRSRRRA